MARPVCTYGNPILRQKSEPVAEVTPEVRTLIDRMFETMYADQGIGLAAEQFGNTEAVFILDVPEQADLDVMGQPLNPGVAMPQAFINPEITWQSEETATADEGCLSFPGMYVPVTRSRDVICSYLDRDGHEQELKVTGLLARAIQHELDHLHGILLVDHMTKTAKIRNGLLLRKFKKSNKKTP